MTFDELIKIQNESQSADRKRRDLSQAEEILRELRKTETTINGVLAASMASTHREAQADDARSRQAQAWIEVASALDKAVPDWLAPENKSGSECAVAAIQTLATYKRDAERYRKIRADIAEGRAELIRVAKLGCQDWVRAGTPRDGIDGYVDAPVIRTVVFVGGGVGGPVNFSPAQAADIEAAKGEW